MQLLPTAPGAAHPPPRLNRGGNGPSATSPSPSPSPGAAVALPGCVGMAPRAPACRISLFKWGCWRTAKQRFRVVKYFGKLCLGFSLKRLSLGKRRRAEQRTQSQEVLGLGCRRILTGVCWGPALGRVTAVSSERAKNQCFKVNEMICEIRLSGANCIDKNKKTLKSDF